MRRRQFIALLGGAAAVWPLAAQAQDPVRGSLATSGTGRDRILRRTAPQRLYRRPKSRSAAALVKAAPDAIIAGPARALQALQSVTHTIPLIGMTEDMVAEGVVPSLAHPGGNITGVSLLSPELDTKRQEILIEAVPGARKIAAMADANTCRRWSMRRARVALSSRFFASAGQERSHLQSTLQKRPAPRR
jgi:hypothetical protein